MGDNAEGKLLIIIYGDSRGAWLERSLRRYQTDKYHFVVRFRRGAGLIYLWELIEYDILTCSRRADFIIVYGGICDLTQRYINRFGRRSYWPASDMRDSFKKVKRTMNDMVNNLRLICPNMRMCFIPEAGVDMIIYNRIHHPVPYRLLILQETFENYLRDLQWVTRLINSRSGLVTPWSLNITHSHRAGRMVPVFGRSMDGLHLTIQQVRRLAQVIVCYTLNEVF